MVSLRRLRTKSTERELEDDFDTYAHKRVVNFQPHCYVQEMALAHAKQFDAIYAIAHTPLLGENEDE
jgi:hypothetical protein